MSLGTVGVQVVAKKVGARNLETFVLGFCDMCLLVGLQRLWTVPLCAVRESGWRGACPSVPTAEIVTHSFLEIDSPTEYKRKGSSKAAYNSARLFWRRTQRARWPRPAG